MFVCVYVCSEVGARVWAASRAWEATCQRDREPRQSGAERGGAERKERRNTTAIYGNGSGRTQSSSKTCFILRPQGPQPSQKLLKHRAEDMLVERRDWSRKERVWTTAPRGLVGEGGSRRHNGDVDQAMTAATAATATATAPTAAAAFAPTT